MEKIEIQNLLEAYYAMGTLKFVECRNHRVQARRFESVAEHVYTAQQWAWLLWSESLGAAISIFRVVAMLSLSELYNTKKSTVILFGNWQKQSLILSLISEFDENKTADAKFAHVCKAFADGEEHIRDWNIGVDISWDAYEKIMGVYNILDTLKPKIRQGVINWNITDVRRESIAEHVYSTQQLAWLMWLETNEEIDILKVVSTLSIHEVEETIIGDITPYSGITPEQKREMGIKAVRKVLGILKQYEFMHSLINEFDDEETPNAFFAHLCDKLDCDLTIKYYSDGGYCSIENATDSMKNNHKIQKLILDGAETVADVFIMADEHMYAGTIFEEVVNFVKTCNVTTI